MKMWFVSWKNLALWIACIIAALVILGFLLFWRPELTPVMEPIYAGPAGKQAVTLMINVDWGEDVLPGLLDELERNRVPVTFFVTGQFVKKHPELAAAMDSGGHEIANHGYSHSHPDQLTLEENQEEITRTQAEIEGLGLTAARLFAPAYGEKKSHVARAAEGLGYQTVYWTIDTLDWQEPSPEEICRRIETKLEDGALILAHPKECTLQALPRIIETVKAANYQFLTVSRMLDS
jgi:peptidoglycan/xylan/chitin deacetylase (PgdA/CDA1 family)